MPHRHVTVPRKFGRRKEARVALMKGLTGQVLLYERVKTTEAKAKEVKPLVERAISVAMKKDPVTAMRQIRTMVQNPKAAEKTVKELKDAYQGRTGGYVRIVRLAPRPGDGSVQAIVELTEFNAKKAPESAVSTEKVKGGKMKVTRKKAGEAKKETSSEPEKEQTE